MKKALIIINPRAGTRQANRVFVDIIDIFCKAGYNVEATTTGGRGNATRIARERAGEFDLVAAIGGDGTFNEVVAGMIESGADTPIGYIPAGSTNDFANSLHLSKDILQAAWDAAYGSPVAIDVGSFNGRYFSYVASFGAFTRASYEAPQSIKNALGHVAYVLEGIKDLPSIRPEKLWIKMEDGVYGGDYLFGAISNSTSVGGVLSLDENVVDMSDGKLEVLLIRNSTSLLELNQVVMNLTSGVYDSPLISFFSSSEMEISADKEMPWTLDGEYQPGSDKIIVKNIHNAVRIILPDEERRKSTSLVAM